ncbi:formate dehydrogenase subunit gamma [Desulfovibrio inopinatus]|uniref:formate dehydrogenase subunit gamma n=1 Tax=Desulfovibrio inopinatus TaxID=102109 RepID=UPI0003FACA23|nr:cytochrome b/b6 domain-containing protein [Desulfovibrio inopinatus]
MTRQFVRHNRWDIGIHWFNFFCWIFLFATGLGLVKNDQINLVGAWWPDLLRTIFGTGGLLLAHEIVGILWVFGFCLYLLVNGKGAIFFLSQTFLIDLKRDIVWMMKKPIHMTMGDEGLKRFGMTPGLPPQGFYNMGQKAFAIAAVLGSIGLIATGLVMILSQTSSGMAALPLTQWSILIHYVCALVVFAGLLVHIYMAAIAPEERPAFMSMFTGSVPEDYAKHHHKLWYEEVSGK